MNSPCDEIRGGGAFIRAEDAVRIAQLGNIGRCYEPEHQLKHGGMKFDYGTDMRAYNPGKHLIPWLVAYGKTVVYRDLIVCDFLFVLRNVNRSRPYVRVQ